MCPNTRLGMIFHTPHSLATKVTSRPDNNIAIWLWELVSISCLCEDGQSFRRDKIFERFGVSRLPSSLLGTRYYLTDDVLQIIGNFNLKSCVKCELFFATHFVCIRIPECG